MSRIVLASTSPTRRQLLANAGVTFEAAAPLVDERAFEEPLLEADTAPDSLAQLLADAKAQSVSDMEPDALVIGADQTLAFEGKRLIKPANMDEARWQLLSLSGDTHALHAAVSVAHDGDIVWRHLATAHMHMRPLNAAEIGHYLGRVGSSALKSVGGYQIEGIGIQLFDRIDGDYFAVLGLPLLPLLTWLRAEGAIA